MSIFRKRDGLRCDGINSEISIGLTERAVTPDYRLDSRGVDDNEMMLDKIGMMKIAFNDQSQEPMDFAFINNEH